MTAVHPAPELIAGGVALLIVAFVAREVASGALRAAGKDLWDWVKHRARRSCRAEVGED